MMLWEFSFELDGTRNIHYWGKSRVSMTGKELCQVVTVPILVKIEYNQQHTSI